jgi:hypothetical protein
MAGGRDADRSTRRSHSTRRLAAGRCPASASAASGTRWPAPRRRRVSLTGAQDGKPPAALTRTRPSIRQRGPSGTSGCMLASAQAQAALVALPRQGGPRPRCGIRTDSLVHRCRSATARSFRPLSVGVPRHGIRILPRVQRPCWLAAPCTPLAVILVRPRVELRPVAHRRHVASQLAAAAGTFH